MALIIVLMVDVRMTISPTLGLEGRLHLLNLPTQSQHHRSQHMVGQQPQTVFSDLQRHMPISDMVGDSRQFLSVLSTHFEQGLELCLDRDHTAIIELESGAMTQQSTRRHRDADRFTRQQHGTKPALFAALEGQFENLVDTCPGIG